MVFSSAIRYVGGRLTVDDVAVDKIADELGTPLYIYSLSRVRDNYRRLKTAFAPIKARIHYSAKANSNRSILRALIAAGAGIDAVSAGEIMLSLHAGAKPQDIVFAGVGKTNAEIQYAVEQGVGWINVENVGELALIEAAAQALGSRSVNVALRLNPNVSAKTHPGISTGHGGAKFGLDAVTIRAILSRISDFPRLDFAGLHMHIGSQLANTTATSQAMAQLLSLAREFPSIRAINLGGGLPVAYRVCESVPSAQDFVEAVAPYTHGYEVLIEPGRSIVADAGILAATVLYVKEQGGRLFYIVDASMTELLRPALYGAHHEVAPLRETDGEKRVAQVVGPVCETTDTLALDRDLPRLRPGDQIAFMTAGAYGMAMASNYNSRPRPAEIVVDGPEWRVSRRRERLELMLGLELELAR